MSLRFSQTDQVKTGFSATFTGFGSERQGGRCSAVGGSVSWTKWDQTLPELAVSLADQSGENSLPATFTGFQSEFAA
jgi:hypothetical protein